MSRERSRTKRVSVKRKVLTPILMLAALVCIAQGVFLGLRMSQVTREMAAEQALIAARATASSVNVKNLGTFRSGSEGDVSYIRAAGLLDVARTNAGVKYAYVLRTDGTEVYYVLDASREEPIGSVFEESYESLAAAFDGREILDKTIYYTEDGALISCYVPLDGGNYILGCDYDAEGIAEMMRANLIFVVILTIAGVMLLGAVAALIISRALRPLKTATAIAEKISSCDLSANDDIAYSNDEIGELTAAFATVADDLRQIIHDIHYQLGEMHNGNYCVRSECPERYQGDYEEILRSLNGIRDALNESMREITDATEQVNEGSLQIAAGAAELSDKTMALTESVSSISDEMQQIYQQAQSMAEYVAMAVEKSRDAGSCVEEGNERLREFTETMQQIEDKSKRIGNIVKTIDDIAFQTNLLALNAAVEAARAGEAGKGFAVVAGEVRTLAQKSAASAQSTGELIGETMSEVSRSLDIARKTAEILSRVGVATVETEEKVMAISENCTQQSTSIEKVNMDVQGINDVVQANNALAEETSATCEELSSQTVAIRQQMMRFKIEV